jgi:pimeloyl-ACP methyl ester carboxylesterase
MNLYFQELGTGFPLVILHGIFGSGDNWLTLGRQFAATHRVFLVDQRNHGRSPWSDEFSYQQLADDLLAFCDAHGLEQIDLIGHSMGGKVSMLFALQHPSRVRRLVIVDIAPKEYQLNEHKHILVTLANFELANYATRTEIDQALATSLPEYSTRQFILKNIYRNEEQQFAWRLNVKGLQQNLQEIGKPLESTSRFLSPALFVNGGKSKYVQPEDHSRIRLLFPLSRIATVPQAGHWVHAEAPDALYALVSDYLATGK